MARFASLAVAAALLGVIPIAAFAQPRSASLTVRVVDDTGGVIRGARVVIVRDAAPVAEGLTGPVGTVTFDAQAPGTIEVRVEAPGFEIRRATGYRLRPGAARLDVRLRVEGVALSVDVSRDAREKLLDPRGDAFARVLTPELIAQLPDDPEELERVINQMAGPGATIRVNGFGGGRLPPKGQIRQIRFSLNAYSAETHELGMPMVDIVTAPGADRWRTTWSAGFRTPDLTARHAYATAPPTDRVFRGGMSIDGPVWRNRTSMSLSMDASAFDELQTILASTPAGRVSGVSSRATDRRSMSLLVEHALTKTHVARAELARTSTALDNLGVGGANLPERAYDTTQRATTVRISDSGPLGRKVYNEIRLQSVWASTDLESATRQPAVVVLDAFGAGGAQMDSARRSWDLEVAENMDVASQKHAIRTGFLLQGGRYRARDANNAEGTFVFSGLDAYAAGRPTTFTRRVGDPLVTYGFYRAGWYVQDEIKVHKSVTLGLGLRHELQSHVEGRLNLAPRVGVTWAPLANGKLVVRGGAGIVYHWFEPTTYEQTLRVDGTRQFDVVITNPGFPDPLAGGLSGVLPPSRLLLAPDLRLPQIVHTSVALQSQFRAGSGFVATYTRQRGHRLFRGLHVNAPDAGVRPDPRFGNVTQVESTARSALDRLDTGVSHAVLKNQRLLFMASVTYSLAWNRNDTDGPFAVPADSRNAGAEWGPAPGDIRHRLSAMVTGSIRRGLRATVIGTAASGSPYSITTGFDDNGDTTINDRPAGTGRNSARGGSQVDILARVGWSFGFGKRAPASQPAGIDTRRMRREGERDPLGVLGSFGPQEHRVRIEFFAQVFNVANRVNHVGYRGVMTSPFFGRPTGALPPRRVELGVRMDF